MSTGVGRSGVGGGVAGGGLSSSEMCDLFDLDDFMMATDCGAELSLPGLISLHPPPIKEEPELDHEDLNPTRYVHSPVGLPIPRRTQPPHQAIGGAVGGAGGGGGGLRAVPSAANPSPGMAFGVGAGGQAAPSAAELGGLLSGSPSTTMWGAAAHPRYSMPSSTSLAASSLAAAAAGHASSVPFPATPFNTPSQGTVQGLMLTAPDFRNLFLSSDASTASTQPPVVSIKEEMPDVGPDFESMTMKALSMFPMEEDDIFQVDKADLIGFSQGPTLAELNANDESLLSDLNFDDFLLPSQHGQHAGHHHHHHNLGGASAGDGAPPTSAAIRYSKSNSSARLSESAGSDRFRMAELNAAFAASPSLSSFELLRTRNMASMAGDDDCLSQLSSAPLGWNDLEQLHAVAMADVTSPTGNTTSPCGIPTGWPSSAADGHSGGLLSASLPANIGAIHAAASSSASSTMSSTASQKLTRRTEEGGRAKPPPPYPTSPPHKNPSGALQELLSLRSPSGGGGGRLPSPNPSGGSHSPSPTGVLQRPTHLGAAGGARQRSAGHASAASSPSPAGGAQMIPQKSPSLAATNPLLLARLSSSAPAPSLMAAAAASSSAASTSSTTTLGASTSASTSAAWQRREPRNRLFSTSSLVEVGEVRGSTSSISTAGGCVAGGGVLSPASFDFSHDEGFDSEDDSDHYEDYDDSDSDSGGSDDDGGGAGTSGGGGGGRASGGAGRRSSGANGPPPGLSKKERFFWQYNVQAKGPKGHKINLTPETVDPHVLNEVQDPVFSPYCSVDGIKHSGKARRGDGNDLTPNPRKLHSIGRELDKLNRLINDMTPVSELPVAVRPKSRKEKNKLASRACRLKKKAQHEANKVKLYGLEQEHRKLMNGIAQARAIVAAKYEAMMAQQQHAEATNRVERIAKSVTVRIAGHSTEFVNKVLERVKSGDPSGGLDEL